MRDPRITALADLLIEYSVELKPGERILIECMGLEIPLAKALIRKAYQVRAHPFLTVKDHELLAALFEGATESHMQEIGRLEAERMAMMDAYIGIRAGRNAAELSSVDPGQYDLYQRFWWEPVHSKIRVPKTKWCVLRYPNHAMAQLAEMSLEAFEDHYFDVCTLDYAKMSKAMDPLVERMANTDIVHIKGPGTDLTFSIKGMTPVKCAGKRNLPDGEVFTAPVRESVNGRIRYNTVSRYMGTAFSDIEFTFKDGRIVEASSNRPERMEQILETDEGARYIGEFSLGFNPYIVTPIQDTLFDEKIQGSFHLTPGQAYEECDNGNRSAIHWDLVCIQRPEFGGGEIWFDGTLIRKDGRFLPDDLEGLNPEHLK